MAEGLVPRRRLSQGFPEQNRQRSTAPSSEPPSSERLLQQSLIRTAAHIGNTWAAGLSAYRPIGLSGEGDDCRYSGGRARRRESFARRDLPADAAGSLQLRIADSGTHGRLG
jgi:hypothetical protein